MKIQSHTSEKDYRDGRDRLGRLGIRAARNRRGNASHPVPVLLLAGLLGLAGSVFAPANGSYNTQPIIRNSPAYEAAATELRKSPPKEYTFNKAELQDVLRFLAEDAGISFIAMPEATGKGGKKLVTFTMNANPFYALETIAKANGVALINDQGIWHMRPFDDKEMVGRTYQVRFNSREEVTADGGGGSGSGGGSNTGGGMSSGGSGSGDMSGMTGISLQGTAAVFETKPSKLVEDIKALLGIATTGFSARLAADASVGNFAPIATAPQAQAPPQGKNGSSAQPQVLWNSDSNTLFVVATRQQHQWVEGYLASADRPQALIAVEVKFFETNKDPREQLGIDWSGTLDGGYPLQLGGLDTVVNLDRIGDTLLPQTAILSAADVNVRVKALLKDRHTTAVSYPRVLTMNNREVVIQSVINQPVLAASSSTTPGVGGTTTASVSYLPIGTVINVLPKKLADGSVQLNVVITISTIVGTEVIDGNPYPVASSRVFHAPLRVDNGYTLAIAGLDEAFDTHENNKVPLLGRLPLIGAAFKSRERSRTRKNLMIFITPSLLEQNGEGIAPIPKAVIPIRPGDPTTPSVDADGHLVGGPENMKNAILWANRHRRYVEQLIKEGRAGQTQYRDIKDIVELCEILLEEVERYRAENLVHPDDLALHERSVLRVRADTKKLRMKLMTSLYR